MKNLLSPNSTRGPEKGWYHLLSDGLIPEEQGGGGKREWEILLNLRLSIHTSPPPQVSLNVHDVAAYILKKQGEMSAMKLQKLVYYSQAWSLVWDEQPLFKAKIEAWANGPVVRALYDKHRGQFSVKQWSDGDRTKVTGEAKKTIDSVLSFYGDKSGQWLSELTHKERPWLDARKGLSDDDRSNHEISPAALAEYYGSL